MEMNVGSLGRLARTFLGTLLFYLTFTNMIGSWGLLGAVLIITGLSGMSLTYALFGINTCETEGHHE